MFRNLFNPDSNLMIFMGQLTDCIFLSLFWILGCFPIVTAGAATAALYDASVRGMRQADKHTWGRFFRCFRQNLKGGILPGLLVAASSLGLGWLLIQVWNATVAGSVSWMVFSAAAFAGILVLGILSTVLPMLSRFENSFPALVKNSLILSLANAPRTIVLGALNALTIGLCVYYIIPLFFLPSLSALLGSFLIEPMFKPFMEEPESM